MLIEDLLTKHNLPLVHKAAVLNDENMRNYADLENPEQGIYCAFDWEDSREGHDFWNCIYIEKFDKAKEICPHLFISDEDQELIKREIKYRGFPVNSFRTISGWSYEESRDYIIFLSSYINENEPELEAKTDDPDQLMRDRDEIGIQQPARSGLMSVGVLKERLQEKDPSFDEHYRQAGDIVSEIFHPTDWLSRAFNEPTDNKTGKLKL